MWSPFPILFSAISDLTSSVRYRELINCAYKMGQYQIISRSEALIKSTILSLWMTMISILPIHYKLCKNLWLPGDMSLGKCTFEEVVILVSSHFQTNITFIFLCWPEDSISPCKGGFKVKKVQIFRVQVIIPFYNYLCCWERTFSFLLAAYLLSCSSSSLFL